MFKSFLKGVNEKGFFHLLGSNFIISFLGFGTIILVSKLLEPSDIGTIKLVQSYTAFFIVLGTFGYNISTLKLCSEKRAQVDKLKIFGLSTKRIILFSIISILLMSSLSYYGLLSNDIVVSEWLIIYSIVIPFAALGYNFVAYFQAIKEIKKMAKLQVIIRLNFIIIIIFSTYFFGFKGLIYSTILSYIIGTLVYLKSIGLKFLEFLNTKDKFPKFEQFALFTLLSNLVTLLGQYSDMYLIDYLESDRNLIGFYSLATVFFIGATVVIGTVQSIVTPYFSEKEDDKLWQKKVWIKYQLIAILMSFCTAITMYILVYLLVEFYFGDTYVLTKGYVLLLMIKFFSWSTYAVTGSALAGLGKIKQGFYLVIFTVPSSIILGYYLYGIYGINGIIYSQIVVNSVVMIIATVYMWSLVRVKN